MIGGGKHVEIHTVCSHIVTQGLESISTVFDKHLTETSRNKKKKKKS